MTVSGARRDGGGLWLLSLFAIGWIGVLVLVLSVVVLAVVLSFWSQFGLDAAAISGQLAKLNTGDLSAIPPWTMALTLGLQFPLMFLLVFAVHFLVDRLWYRARPGLVSRPRGWSGVFALFGAPWVSFAAAVVIGLTVGMLPGWIAEQIRALDPDSRGAVEMINDTLTKGPIAARAVAILAVTLVGPLVEELVFRGFMWDALRRFGSPAMAMVGTSFLFAAYHMDPAQSFALLITAFTLGWVRWMSGSVWPCVVVHVVNNGLGVLAAFVAVEGSFGASIATAGVSLVTCALLGLHHVRSRGSLASDLPPGV